MDSAGGFKQRRATRLDGRGRRFAATLRKMSKATEEFGFDLQYTKDGQLDVIASLQAMSRCPWVGLDDIDQEDERRLAKKSFGEEGVRGVGFTG